MRGTIRTAVFAALLLGLNACTAPEPQTSAPAASLPPPPPAAEQLALLDPASLPKGPLQCVPYARLTSGIPIRGDAWTWWGKAKGAYLRGNLPQIGAVLVFKKTSRLQRGHVSVVARIVGPREILVTHANWGSTSASRGKVAHNVRVIDDSLRNDWTEIKVWNEYTGSFGKSYPAYGFIYRPPPTQPAAVSAAPAS
ncbi:MAG TPA: CHAP domain-containing protein [Dongiaceae bacterium]